MQAFPPRKPEQPIFYPVLNLRYANEIAERWNTHDPLASGFSTKFEVDDVYIRQFETHQVGGAHHVELWIPAGELVEFNQHIFPPISVVSAYFGQNFQGHVPSEFGLRGKNAKAQFVALALTLDYSHMDFHCEITANHTSIFLNYAFWLKTTFTDNEINENQRQRVLAAIYRVWSEAFPKIHLPLSNK